MSPWGQTYQPASHLHKEWRSGVSGNVSKPAIIFLSQHKLEGALSEWTFYFNDTYLKKINKKWGVFGFQKLVSGK